MKGALIYFSGTGNTEYVIKKFKEEFADRGVESDLINTSMQKTFEKQYDFYVFGAPIHAEMFPNYYIEWVKENIKKGTKKKCIIFSTQASSKGIGVEELYNILKEKNMKVIIKDFIEMPNNYYVVMFKKNSQEEIQKLKKSAEKKVEKIVEYFLYGSNIIKKVSKTRVFFGKIAYSMFYKYSLKWAYKNLSVDEGACVKCEKCVNECPTNNISMTNGNITFGSTCISCQHCIHKCPVNAFRYKGKKFEQYKI
ncbi:EFR1 family ferrodoxin [Clostridium sp. MB40-C1]|uniref:EFR1 family ferrodoxin n=1 Tax=Clostridium sp. MB40-C1 TaxID=3070996 RepID=UPI0027DFD399|nr:EFR1 family ferrodoxin [Clostridium sp. MB40-C1]WMJ79497.1 EFR1 family ferrodoxin [Clostridium sp. MB40-C1]